MDGYDVEFWTLLDKEYRLSPGPVSLGGLGVWAIMPGQVVHKVIDENVRVATPSPDSLRGRRPLLLILRGCFQPCYYLFKFSIIVSLVSDYIC